MVQQKGHPPDANKTLWPSPEAPWQPPLCAAVFQTKQLSEQETPTATPVLISESISSHLLGMGSSEHISKKKNNPIMNEVWNNQKLAIADVLFAFPFQRQWSDTLDRR